MVRHVRRLLPPPRTAAALLAVAAAAVAVWQSGAWPWLNRPVDVPRWWYWTLLAVLAVAGGRLCVSGALRFAEPKHLRYTADVFLGLRWRWAWSEMRGVAALTPHCPACDRVIVPATAAGTGRPVTTFACAPCGVSVARPGPAGETEYRVVREIDQKVRLGTWRQAVTGAASSRAAATTAEAADAPAGGRTPPAK